MTAAFTLPQPPMLSRATYDRAADLRADTDRLRARWPAAHVLRVDDAGRYAIGDDGHLRWAQAPAIGSEPPSGAVFLGHGATAPVPDGDLWALRSGEIDGGTDDPRRGAHALSADESGLLASALSLLNWHARARFSPVDGHRTEPVSGGWTRRDVETGADEFPRTDPAVITVVHNGDDRILLGRQPAWPAGWFSTLAGFVEAGESLEQCVIREVHEEVGITVTDPHYLGSQPWPFPRSLMLGFEATGDPTAPLEFLDGEIADAAWFTRSEVLAALDNGDDWGVLDRPGESGRRLRLPGSISIARAMITAWAHAGNG